MVLGLVLRVHFFLPGGLVASAETAQGQGTPAQGKRNDTDVYNHHEDSCSAWTFEGVGRASGRRSWREFTANTASQARRTRSTSSDATIVARQKHPDTPTKNYEDFFSARPAIVHLKMMQVEAALKRYAVLNPHSTESKVWIEKPSDPSGNLGREQHVIPHEEHRHGAVAPRRWSVLSIRNFGGRQR